MAHHSTFYVLSFTLDHCSCMVLISKLCVCVHACVRVCVVCVCVVSVCIVCVACVCVLYVHVCMHAWACGCVLGCVHVNCMRIMMCQVHNVNINCSIIYCSLWCMVVDKDYNTVLLS